MFRILLGEVVQGRLARLPYLGYSLLIMALMLGVGVAMSLSAGLSEQLVGGDLQQLQDKLSEWLALPAMLMIMAVKALFAFMSANLMAKRASDIGLPGWWTVFAATVLTGVVSYWFSGESGNGLHTLFWLALLLVPGRKPCRRPEYGLMRVSAGWLQ